MIIDMDMDKTKTLGGSQKLVSDFVEQIDGLIHKGQSLYTLPFKYLTTLELAEVYMYCIFTFGRKSVRTHVVVDALESRKGQEEFPSAHSSHWPNQYGSSYHEADGKDEDDDKDGWDDDDEVEYEPEPNTHEG